MFSSLRRLFGRPRCLEINPSTPAVRCLSSAKVQKLSRSRCRQSLMVKIAQHLEPRKFLVAHDPNRHPEHLPSCARGVSFQTGRKVTFSSGIVRLRYIIGNISHYRHIYPSRAVCPSDQWLAALTSGVRRRRYPAISKRMPSNAGSTPVGTSRFTVSKSRSICMLVRIARSGLTRAIHSSARSKCACVGCGA